MSGGNDLPKHNKTKFNDLRNKINNFIFKSTKKNIPIIGMPWGSFKPQSITKLKTVCEYRLFQEY